jgi:hypothetical protein
VLRWPAKVACFLMVMHAFASARAQETASDPTSEGDAQAAESGSTGPGWMENAHSGLHSFLWRSAMTVDGWFGGEMPEEIYQQKTRGSITPIVLWDQYNGLQEKFRFRVKMPLPQLDERYNAFIGTFSRDEFVTERDQASGTIPRQRAGGVVEQDETLLGIQFRDRDRGGRFEADAGLRIRSPLDPFVKAGYRFDLRTLSDVRWTLRQTVFWQHSEQFGTTSRVDFERVLDDTWLLRWTASGTISQESEGVRGYTALTAYRALRGERAVAAQLFTSSEFDAPVPLGEYGIRAAYRQRVLADWLVIELRPSVTWPKERPEQQRRASWGLGIGFEIFFGMDEFQARPATF